MDFTTATDRLGQAVTHQQIAEGLGMSLQTVRQARLDPNNTNYRRPPEGWRTVLARLARERSGELAELADELEAS